MKFFVILSLALCFSLSLEYHLLEGDKIQELSFPPEYRVSGEKILVGSQIIVPFKAWFSSRYNKSRIDYYRGMVKRYYYGQSGRTFEIHPVTDRDVTNEMTCYETKDKGAQKDFLPSPAGYEFVGDEKLNGYTAKKWLKKNYEASGYKTEETLWTTPTAVDGMAIPLRYEYKEVNIWLGKSNNYMIVNYFNFMAKVQIEDFELEDEKCKFLKVGEGDLCTLAFVEPERREHVDTVFAQFKDKHERQYEDDIEHEMRKAIFRRNLEKVLATNHKKLGYTLALNKFADRTEEELHHLTTLKHDVEDVGAAPFPYDENMIREMSSKLPEEYDMRLANLITPVQNQLTCGSCWAFAAVATAEGAYARADGGWVMKLSEQALLDCAWGFSGKGCHGGKLGQTFAYARDVGVPTDGNYGVYLAMEGYCHMKNMTSVLKIREFIEMKSFSVNDLKVALYNHGPVAVKVNVHDAMRFYSGGIFYDENCEISDTSPVHAMTVVGYGKRNGELYWIVKNSWGQDWGFGGYILMSAKNNNCTIHPVAFYVNM